MRMASLSVCVWSRSVVRGRRAPPGASPECPDTSEVSRNHHDSPCSRHSVNQARHKKKMQSLNNPDHQKNTSLYSEKKALLNGVGNSYGEMRSPLSKLPQRFCYCAQTFTVLSNFVNSVIRSRMFACLRCLKHK